MLRDEIERAFKPELLQAICEMDEMSFADLKGMTYVETEERYPEDFYCYQDNGSDVLFVAHLDTVVPDAHRTARFVETHDGLVIHSGALDDRLGAYVGLSLLPELGVDLDILLTVGEEMGRSTAAYFEPSKEYNWMIEFDRGGTDVVMYEYEDAESCALVRKSGAKVGNGSFSDICYLNHLEVKGFNWGVGYDGNYHSVRGFAYLDDTFDMVEKFLDFYEENREVYLPHERLLPGRRGGKVKPWWEDDVYADVVDDITWPGDQVYGETTAHGDDEFAAQRKRWEKSQAESA